MLRFLIAATAALMAAARPVCAFAQTEPGTAVLLLGSWVDDQTERPAAFNPACWKSQTTKGAGIFVDFRFRNSFALQTGYHYLGGHRNVNCTPSVDLKTHAFPLTISYSVPVGSALVISPKIGVTYMLVQGEYGAQTSYGHSVGPTYGVQVEGPRSRGWRLRGQVDRYTGNADLFGFGKFKQAFWVASIGFGYGW